MKRFLFLPAAAIALFGAVGLLGAPGASAADPAPLVVKVGDGQPGYAVTQFLPSNVTIQTGSTIEFDFAWFELHNIALFEGDGPAGKPVETPSPATFPNPSGYVFSGDINGDPANPTKYSIKFTKAGTYSYTCFIHRGMDASVKVVDAGSAGAGSIDNQLSATARANAQYNSGIVQLKVIGAGLKGAPDASKPGGGKTVESVLGNFTPGIGQVLQFAPSTINVREGDSVRWVSQDGAPHDVVFGAPPHASPFEFPGAKSGSSYDGTKDTASGIISQDDFGPATAKSFELVFTKAGSYNYLCLLHADQGMVGTVVVQARGTTAPLPPNTGTGRFGDGLNGWYVIIGALLLAAGVGASGVAKARR